MVNDIQATHQHLKANGVDVSEVDLQDWGHFVYFADPDGNRWAVQYVPGRDKREREGEAACV